MKVSLFLFSPPPLPVHLSHLLPAINIDTTLVFFNAISLPVGQHSQLYVCLQAMLRASLTFSDVETNIEMGKQQYKVEPLN